MKSNSFLKSLLVAIATTCSTMTLHAVTTTFVSNGVPVSVIYEPASSPWSTNVAGYLEQSGTGTYLFGPGTAGANDFHVYSRLSLAELNGTAASFDFGSANFFGFDGSGSSALLFGYGSLFGGGLVLMDPASDYIEPGVPFDFEVVRSGTNMSFLINGTNVYTTTLSATNDPGQVGFRPWRNTMDLYDFSIVQPIVIRNVQPAPGTPSFSYDPSQGISFEVVSDAGVATNAIHVTLNGQDVSSQLSFTGTSNDWNVVLSGYLTANEAYAGQIVATDVLGNIVTQSVSFDTFTQGIKFIEGENYDFDGGQFIDDVVLSSSDGPSNYLDRLAVAGIDVDMHKPAGSTIYRIGDLVTTGVSGDYARSNYLAAEEVDPGVADYYAGGFVQDDWLNYTRTLTSGFYDVYARVAKTGTPTFTATLGKVTSGAGTTSQSVSTLGVFQGAATGGSQTYEYVRLTDVFGKPITIPLGGVTTLRFSPLHGAPDLNLNYFALVPQSAPAQPPFVASISPAPWASSNVVTTPTISATVLDGTTTLATGSVQLLLDGSDVSGGSTISAVPGGNQIAYQVTTPLSLGTHDVKLIYSDSAAQSFTNQWTFFAANQNVYGYWQFLGGTPGENVSTNIGAIIDSSGNGRNGTAGTTGMVYVAGSPAFGGTPAIHFANPSDFIRVPDPAGVFNFRGAVTFEALIRTTNTASTPAILAKNGGSTSTGEGEYWWRAPGVSGGIQRLGLLDGRSPSLFLPGTIPVNDGQWHHVAAVVDPDQSQVRLYVDYNLDAEADNVSLPGIIGWTSDLFLGNFVAPANDGFGGDINFIRISAGALPVSQFVHPTGSLLPYIFVVSPSPGDANVLPGSTVEATIVNRTTSAVLSSVDVSVDGTSVPTNQVTVTPTGTGADVSWPIPGSLVAGVHTVTVSVYDDGQPATLITNAWSFTIPANPLVRGYWQYDEQSPDGGAASESPEAIRDMSGNGRNLTAVGNPPPTYVPSSGVYGSPAALHFSSNSLDEVVSDAALGSAYNFSSNEDFTAEASFRINPPGSVAPQTLMLKAYAVAQPGWWLRVYNGVAQFLIEDGPNLVKLTGTTIVNDGNWHHVAAVRDATNHTVSLYVDYQLDASGADPTTGNLANPEPFGIGSGFMGDIDFVRIVGAALTPSQFLQPGPPAPWDISAAGGQFQFSFQSTAGTNYVIQETTDLKNPVWTDLENISGDGSVFTPSYPLNGSNEFFEVKLVP